MLPEDSYCSDNDEGPSQVIKKPGPGVDNGGHEKPGSETETPNDETASTYGIEKLKEIKSPPPPQEKPSLSENTNDEQSGKTNFSRIVPTIAAAVLICVFAASVQLYVQAQVDMLQNELRAQRATILEVKDEFIAYQRVQAQVISQLQGTLRTILDEQSHLQEEVKALRKTVEELQQTENHIGGHTEAEESSVWSSLYSKPAVEDSVAYRPSPVLYKLSPNKFTNFFNSMMKSEEFKSQSEDTWVQLLSSIEPTMEEKEPSRPSSILILSPPSLSPTFGFCFAKKIATAVNKAFQTSRTDVSPKVLDMYYFSQMSGAGQIHDDIKNYLDFQGKAVIVNSLDKIQDEPLLMTLHAFCENSGSMAYDRRANFFSILSVTPEIYNRHEWTHWQGKRIAMDMLNFVWKDALSEDKRSALVSRVASAVVLLNDGDSCD